MFLILWFNFMKRLICDLRYQFSVDTKTLETGIVLKLTFWLNPSFFFLILYWISFTNMSNIIKIAFGEVWGQ